MAVEFKNKAAVLKYLHNSGRRIGRSQFYEDCRSGLLRPGKDGKYSGKAVDRYASVHTRNAETGGFDPDEADLARLKKERVRHEREQVRLEREQLELRRVKGELVPRDSFELEVVGRAVAMLTALENAVQAEAEGWVGLVGGDAARVPDLVAAVLSTVERGLAVFAVDPEFSVIIEK